ncbi:MAG: hypothetical protein SX243_12005 [Acidobacteriota bacterium]|nr:hypothetical protein [Acidobacteriota bacterium]
MATPYDDLYVRSRVGDPGTIPRSTAGLSSSPDVIPYGLMPVDKPEEFFKANFDQSVGSNVFSNTANYLYVRGENLYDGARSGDVYLYYAESNLLLYPSVWRENLLYTSDQKDHISVSAAAKNDIWVTPEPFRWIAPPPPSGFHYCLIGRVVTEDHPNPIPNTGDIQSFAGWIADNGGLGWRNVSLIDSKTTFTRPNEYSQGSTGDVMEINLIANNLPVGSEVWLTSGTRLPDGDFVSIPVTKITQPRQIIGTSAFIPAGWQTTFSYSYRSNDQPPPEGFDLSVRVNYATVAGTALYAKGKTLEELGLEDMVMWSRERRRLEPAHEHYARRNKAYEADPVRLIVVGADTTRHKDGAELR